MSIEQHLILQESTLFPSGEWVPHSMGWTMLRVANGYGYGFYGGSPREIKLGDTLIAGPSSGLTLRASQLCELKFEFFLVMPARLNGLITVVEWRQLEHVPSQASPRVFYYGAKEALAQKFARLAMLSRRNGLAERSALLQLWASGVTSLVLDGGESGAGRGELRNRFRQFISKIPEQDLATCSLADMSAELNCSERHFNRLFREEFGITFRKCQTESCLQRAQALLVDSHVKISSIAYKCGFQHRSFFSAVFKKRFGLSPNEWRQQNLPPRPKSHTKSVVSSRANGDTAGASLGVPQSNTSKDVAETTDATAATQNVSGSDDDLMKKQQDPAISLVPKVGRVTGNLPPKKFSKKVRATTRSDNAAELKPKN